MKTLQKKPQATKAVQQPAKKAQSKPRKGWSKAFKLMHARQEDALLMPDTKDSQLDWEW